MNRGIRFVILVSALSNLLIPSVNVLAESDLSIDVPLQALNSNQAISLHGLISTQSVDIPLPLNWKITEQSWLELDISASELLDFSSSSITISLNGLQIKSLQLDKAVDSIQTIKISADFFKPGKNTLAFSGTLYLPDDLATNCKGWDDPSRWLLIGTQSKIHISLQQETVSSDLSHFSEVFLQSLDRYLPEGEDQLLFVLPDTVAQDDLYALSALAFVLGHEGGENFVLNSQVITKSQFGSLQVINSNIIFINNLPVSFEGTISLEKNAIAMFPSPWNDRKTIAIIYDRDRDDGYTPAVVLSDTTRKVLLTGNIVYLDQVDPSTPPAFKNKYSFEELGYLDRTVRGIGNGNLIYRVYIPYNVDPSSAMLSVQLAHSPDLDVRTSSFSIFLNGFTVASILPTAQSTSQEPIQVDLPPNRFRPGINFVRFSFDLHLPYSSCEKAPESVWATIFNYTTLEMTYQERTSIASLDDFPMPFSAYPGFSFVIPNQLENQTLNHLAQLAFTIGASSFYANKPPNVLTEAKYLDSEPAQANYIFIGFPSTNQVIENVNDFLPQPFTKDLNQLQDGFGIFLPSYDQNASIGLLQIIPSPLVKNGTILVLTGTDQQGMDWAWDVILDPNIRDQFSGNIMVIGSEKRTASPSSQYGARPDPNFQQTPVVINIPIIGKFLQGSAISGSVSSLIAIFMAAVIILITIRVRSFVSGYEIRKKSRRQSEDHERE